MWIDLREDITELFESSYVDWRGLRVFSPNRASKRGDMRREQARRKREFDAYRARRDERAAQRNAERAERERRAVERAAARIAARRRAA